MITIEIFVVNYDKAHVSIFRIIIFLRDVQRTKDGNISNYPMVSEFLSSCEVALIYLHVFIKFQEELTNFSSYEHKVQQKET